MFDFIPFVFPNWWCGQKQAHQNEGRAEGPRGPGGAKVVIDLLGGKTGKQEKPNDRIVVMR